MTEDWFQQELEALNRQLLNGEISHSYHRRECEMLRRDLAEQQYVQDMIDAGRGHLLP